MDVSKYVPGFRSLMNEIPLNETVNGSIGSGTNPFCKPQYLLLNLAVGGINGGEIDDKEIPMRYEIDYVRFYTEYKPLHATND